MALVDNGQFMRIPGVGDYYKGLFGDLVVQFEPSGRGYRNIFLIGPAMKVYDGTVEV